MEMIKKGSKGESVKVLQKYLGITQDGVFGANTETAVKKFQMKLGLTPDGIVGEKTWAALKQSAGSKAVTDCVIYNPLSVHITPYKGRDIKYLAIHFTAGSSSQGGRAMNVKRTFETSQASADFCVDDRDIVQFNPDIKNYYCWAVGDAKKQTTGGAKFNGLATNSNTISIEICSSCKYGYSLAVPNHEGWYFTEEVLANAVKLTKLLMQKYGIPIGRVVRHYDSTGKLCPALVGWNDHYVMSNDGKTKIRKNNSEQWQAFKARLK